jgi:hypothetical protein
MRCSKSHVTHIKIFIDSSNSIKFDWIKKHTTTLWVYKSPRTWRHAVTSRPSSPATFQQAKWKDIFFTMQGAFIVEHCLASRSYLNCQNEFRGTFPDSLLLNKSTVSRLVNNFRDTGCASSMRKEANACIAERGGQFLHLTSFFPGFNLISFLTDSTCQELVAWLSDHSELLVSKIIWASWRFSSTQTGLVSPRCNNKKTENVKNK